jgi:hypothetical protein
MARLDISIHTGYTWARTFVWKDKNNQRVPLAGMRGIFICRLHPRGDILFQVIAPNLQLQQESVDGDATGVISLVIPGSITVPVRHTFGYHELRLEMADDSEPSFPLLYGDVYFRLGTTP